MKAREEDMPTNETIPITCRDAGCTCQRSKYLLTIYNLPAAWRGRIVLELVCPTRKRIKLRLVL